MSAAVAAGAVQRRNNLASVCYVFVCYVGIFILHIFLIIITQIHATLTTVTAVFILQQMCTLRALVIMNSLISALTSTKYQHTTNMHYLSHCRYRP